MHDENLTENRMAEAKKIIASTVAALQLCERRLDAHSKEIADVDLLRDELIVSTLLDIHVCLYFSAGFINIHFPDFSAWLNDPITMATKNFEVDAKTFCRWAKANEEAQGSGGGASMTCRHEGCKMSNSVRWQTPAEMQNAELTASREVWYCHYHQQKAWDLHRVLSYDLVQLLSTVQAMHSCNKAKLGGKRSDVDFLISIGLIVQKAVPRGTRSGYIIRLSEEGERYLSEHNETSRV